MKFAIFGLGASVYIRPLSVAWVAELLCHPRGPGLIKAQFFHQKYLHVGTLRVKQLFLYSYYRLYYLIIFLMMVKIFWVIFRGKKVIFYFYWYHYIIIFYWIFFLFDNYRCIFLNFCIVILRIRVSIVRTIGYKYIMENADYFNWIFPDLFTWDHASDASVLEYCIFNNLLYIFFT